MEKNVSYVTAKKSKTRLDQFQIRIEIENKFISDKLLNSKMPFKVRGKEQEDWHDKQFELTDFSERVEDLLKHSWEELIGRIKELLEEKGNRIDEIMISIISSGPHIIPVFHYSYHYNDGEDYGHDVFNSYIATQQIEDYYVGWSSAPAYLPTKELLIEFNLDLEKKYKKRCIFKNISFLNYRT